MKRLEVGKTVIGTVVLKTSDNTINEFSVVYGNTLIPPINNQAFHLDLKEYREMLNAFLNETPLDSQTSKIAPGGSEYEKPTEKEVNDAIISVANRIQEFENARKEKDEKAKSYIADEERNSYLEKIAELEEKNRLQNQLIEDIALKSKEEKESLSAAYKKKIRELKLPEKDKQERILLKAVSVCLIIASLLLWAMFFLYVLK